MTRPTPHTADTHPIVIAPETELAGILAVAGDLRFEGRIEGEIRCGGRVELGQDASVRGTLRCRSLHLCGAVDGDVIVDGTAEIGPGAQLSGTLYALMVRFEEGGSYFGRIHMGQSAITRAETEVKPFDPSRLRAAAAQRDLDEVSGNAAEIDLPAVEARLRSRLAELEAAVTSLA